MFKAISTNLTTGSYHSQISERVEDLLVFPAIADQLALSYPERSKVSTFHTDTADDFRIVHTFSFDGKDLYEVQVIRA